MPRKQPEADQQIELVRRIRLAAPKIWFWHTPNERMLRKDKEGDVGAGYKLASHLRKMGVDKGVLDITIESPAPKAPHGCRIELKAKGRSLTEEQYAWSRFYASINMPCATFYHADQATRWLQNLGYWLTDAPTHIQDNWVVED